MTIHGYRPYAPGGSATGFVVEYAYSFLATARLALKARRLGRFDVVQACNPPDIFWPLGLWFRGRDGSRFVFDHHDLCPELFESRFPAGSPLALRGLRLLERATFRAADRVISTNESYRAIAIRRGGKEPHDVTVVRTGPDPQVLTPVAPVPSERRGRTYLAAYLGVMGPQDGVDIVLRAADHVVHTLGRTDIAFTLMGGGDCHEELVAERDRLGLQEHVELPGRVPDEYVVQVLSTADVGLCPDPLNPLNDLSTMNKTMEYMAFGLPVVSFDLVETRVSADGAAVYADPTSGAEGFAETLLALLDDPEARSAMARTGSRARRHAACLAAPVTGVPRRLRRAQRAYPLPRGPRAGREAPVARPAPRRTSPRQLPCERTRHEGRALLRGAGHADARRQPVPAEADDADR